MDSSTQQGEMSPSARTPAAREFDETVSLPRRFGRAALRRWSYAWGRKRLERRRMACQRAMEHLHRFPLGLPAAAGTRPWPAATGTGLGIVSRFGQRELAARWLRWLLQQPRDDGAFVDAASKPSAFHTASALGGLLAVQELGIPDESTQARIEQAIERAGGHLASRLSCEERGGEFSVIDQWGFPASRLTCLPPLLESARRLGRPDWEQAVWRESERVPRTVDLARQTVPTHIWALGANALLSLGRRDLAARMMNGPVRFQRRDGAAPAMGHERWISSPGLAQLATVWYGLKDDDSRRRADRALECLLRRQFPSGGFPGSFGPDARFFPEREVPAAAAWCLQAARLQVRSTFDAGRCDFPAEILPDDGRLQAVLAWAREIGASPRIADVGCGRGRYLRHLQRALPQARLSGVDDSPAMLRELPPEVDARRGSLLRIPAADNEFDAVLCVEALEHSLLPGPAVAELCRITRPGGRMLIIDKDQAQQPYSDCHPWERWFTPQEVSDWLSPHCRQTTVKPLSHCSSNHPGDAQHQGLFLCWEAIRK